MPVEVGLDRDVPVVRVEAVEQRRHGVGRRRAALGQPALAGVDGDRPVDERGRGAGAAALEHLPRGRLGALDVGLVERVDADHPAGDRGGVLPEQHLRAQGPVDRGVPARGRLLRHVVGAVADQHRVGRARVEVGRVAAADDDREDALAVLAGRLRDELLDPVAEVGVRRPGVRQHQLVDATHRSGAQQRAQAEAGVALGVLFEVRAHRLGLVEQALDVGARQAAGHQPERGERGVAAADVRIGQEDPVAGGPGRLLQRRTGVGDDHDPLGGVDADVGERLLVGALLAVGLDCAAGLAGHHDDGLGEPVLGRRPDHVGVRGVQHRELDAGRLADHLRRERRPAHAAQHDVGDALLAQLHAERRDVGHQSAGRLGERDPGEPLAGLVLGRVAPQGGVLRRRSGWRPCPAPGRRGPARTPRRRAASHRSAVTSGSPRRCSAEERSGGAKNVVGCSFPGPLHLALDGLRPARPRTWRTSRRPRARARPGRRRSRCPTAASWSKTCCAASACPLTVSPRTSPWSANASIVFSGIVLTVSATTSSVT